MTVRIGKVELVGLQDIYTVEARNLVEQRAPEQKGSVFQDLGRDPVTVVMEGLLFGQDVLENLEKLRQAQDKAEPLPFAADIAVGTELTEVIIEDIKVRQVAGYVDRYRFSIRVREYIAPPESRTKASAQVDQAVAADADAWADDSLAAAAGLQDPAALPAILQTNPTALNQLSAEDLSKAVGDNAAGLSGANLGGILKSVGGLDSEKMGGMLDSLNKKGALGGFMEKFSKEGLNLKKMLKGVDLKGLVQDLVGAFTGGVEFIQKAKKVGEMASKLFNDLKAFDPLAGLEDFLEKK